MKVLFIADRLHLNHLNGYSINAKRLMEGLKKKGLDVHAICHGKSNSIKVHQLSNFSLYNRVISFPITSFLTIKKINEVLVNEKFDAIIVKPLIHSGTSFWNSFPAIPLKSSIFFSILRKKAKQQKAKLLFLVDGITEKNSFPASLVGSTKQNHLNQLKNCDGVIVLSNSQKQLLRRFGVRTDFFVFPASVDTKIFAPRKSKLSKNLNLLYLSSSAEKNDLIPLFKVLKLSNKKVNFFISMPSNKELNNLVEDFELQKRVNFLGKIKQDKLVQTINSMDIGVYLKQFNFPIGDASSMVKVSEYLACGLPVMFPKMTGVLEQSGSAGIVLSNGSVIQLNSFAFNKKLLKDYSKNARRQAVEKLDLNKNLENFKNFLERVVSNA